MRLGETPSRGNEENTAARPQADSAGGRADVEPARQELGQLALRRGGLRDPLKGALGVISRQESTRGSGFVVMQCLLGSNELVGNGRVFATSGIEGESTLMSIYSSSRRCLDKQ